MPENTNIEDLNYNLSALHEKNVDMFRNITENSQIGIFMYHHNFLYANKALCEQSGYTLEELYGMNIWNLADESCRGKVKELILKRCCGELLEKLSHDFKLLTKNGEIKTVRIIVQTMQYNGKYVGVGTIIDISDIDKAKQKLVLLAQAIEHTDDMVKITDKSGTIIFVNDSVVKHSGYNRTEILGQTPRIFKSGQHDDGFYKNIWSTILYGETFKGILINKKKSGRLFYEQETITPINDENNILKYFVVTSKDISERVEMEHKLYERATIDGLTGIYNRQKCIEHIDMELDRYKRYNSGFALIMLDIDDFKNVNDTHGHDVGDDVLKELSRIVSQKIRKSDIFSRWGGEEFMIVAPDLTEDEAVFFSEKLREEIGLINFEKIGRITASFGITFPKQDETKDELLKRVDKALYISKANGKNKIHTL